MRLWTDKEEKNLLQWKAEKKQDVEIAALLERSVKSVRKKLEKIRKGIKGTRHKFNLGEPIHAWIENHPVTAIKEWLK